MIAFVISLSLGLLLAQRFKALVLMPASVLVALGTFISGRASSGSIGVELLVAGVAAVSLQLGYFLGLAAHALIAGTQADRAAGVPIPKSLRSVRSSERSVH
jgi:hypothetical protein